MLTWQGRCATDRNGHLDDRDSSWLAEAMTARGAADEPREGDWLRFADGTVRRVSAEWPDGVQTSAGGSYHLSGNGYVSMSGSLYGSTPRTLIRPTDEWTQGEVWIWHHGIRRAANGVPAHVYFRVFETTEQPTT